MKKILALSIMLSLVMGSSVFAATTYTENFIQSKTQKIVDTEKKLQEKQAAKKAEYDKKKQANQAALEKKKQEREAAKKQTQQKIEKKKQLFNQLINE